MTIQKKRIVLVGALLLPFACMSIASALTAACTGSPTTSAITWSASAQDGVAPFTFLWGNGSTATTQTIAVSPGTYSMTLQVTDASSTVATTTCSATVQQTPTITSFIATPASITVGQSSLLSWVVSNASSTSINNGVGVVTGTSVTVTPGITTTYQLSAVNPGGTTTANATVTVHATTTPPSGLAAQIQALLAQIKALQAQIFQLIAQNAGGGGSQGGTATSTPRGCFSFWRNLKRGDFGDDVKELQQQLAHDNPTLFPPGLVTGFFGPKTEAALRMFQRRFGIDAEGTGFFGMKSRAFFKSQCSNGDADNDGIVNSADADDDNDGTPDVNDKFPFNPNATSTSAKKDTHDNRGKSNDKKRGNSDDDDDDDD